MRQREAARGQIEKVRGKKKSHQVGSKSVEALSKPNDSAASPRTSLTLLKPSLPLSIDVSLQAVSSCHPNYSALHLHASLCLSLSFISLFSGLTLPSFRPSFSLLPFQRLLRTQKKSKLSTLVDYF